MEQSKLESFLETSINVGTGFIVSWFVWRYIAAPAFGIHLSESGNLAMNLIFTVSAVIRQYFWRRFFAKGVHRRIHAWVLTRS